MMLNDSCLNDTPLEYRTHTVMTPKMTPIKVIRPKGQQSGTPNNI